MATKAELKKALETAILYIPNSYRNDILDDKQFSETMKDEFTMPEYIAHIQIIRKGLNLGK